MASEQWNKIISKNQIILNCNARTKKDTLLKIAEKAKKLGFVTNSDELYQVFENRENEASTNLANSFAIPHARSNIITKTGIFFFRLTKPISWEDQEESKVKNIVVLLIPENENENYLSLLTKISQKLLDLEVCYQLKSETNKDKIISLFFEDNDENLTVEKETNLSINKDNNNTESKGLILAVTACPAGIAHTYLAAKNIENYGKELGYTVKVEKQGANGIEDKLTEDEIKQAQILIIAAEVTLTDSERFINVPILKVPVTEPVRNIAGVFEKVKAIISKSENNKKNYSNKNIKNNEEITKAKKEKNWFKVRTKKEMKGLKNGILTGISYLIPVIVGGTTIMALATIINQIFTTKVISDKANWINDLNIIGGQSISVLLAPILGAFIAYGIADKPGIAPGFLGGLACNSIKKDNPDYISGTDKPQYIVDGLGFLGGLVIGIIAGYLMRFMKNYLVIRKNQGLQGVITWFVYPVLGSLATISLVLFGIGYPLANFLGILFKSLNSLQQTKEIFILGAVMGILHISDLGGPFNKVGWAFGVASFNEAFSNNQITNPVLLLPYSCCWAASISSGWTTLFVTTVLHKTSNQYEKEAGKSAWILSSLGITEGSIPFALSDPFIVIPSFIIGGAVSGGLCALLGLGSTILGGGFITMAGVISVYNHFSKGIAIALWFGVALIGGIISSSLIISLKLLKNKLAKAKKKTNGKMANVALLNK